MKPTNHKVLLVGEAPNCGGMRSHLLESILLRMANRPAVRSCSDAARCWLEFTDEPRVMALAAEVHHVNLLDEWPGRKQRGSAFPAQDARRMADYLYLWLQRRQQRYPYVLLAGQRVASAFRFGGQRPFLTFPMANRATCVVPHPSGLNRWWSSEHNRAEAQQWLLDLGEVLRLVR